MTIRLDDVSSLTRLLSKERLRALIDLTGSPKIAIELHQDTLRLGASMMTVVATIEIALRNSVCENLQLHFGVANWLRQPLAPFQWRAPELANVAKAHDSARRADYAKLSQLEKHGLDALAYPNGRPPSKSHLQRAKDRRKQIVVSDGKVIAELSLYFWKRLYGPEYDQSLWRTTLKRTFPDKKVLRAHVAVQLETIYQTRNRLAHHEPVLHNRFQETIKSIKFITEYLGATLESDTTPLADLLSADLIRVGEEAALLHGRLASFRVQ